MRLLDVVRKNPVALLCVVAAGVGGWAISAAVHGPPPVEAQLVVPPNVIPVPSPARGEVHAVVIDDQPPREYRVVSGEMLPKIKPGMTRVEIEDLLGPPTSNSLEPVVAAEGGRMTYHTAYELADPSPPPTVRPIGPGRRPLPRPQLPGPPALLALEFDASKPGHPLIGVVYLDPLF